jgi:hypothetical protein
MNLVEGGYTIHVTLEASDWWDVDFDNGGGISSTGAGLGVAVLTLAHLHVSLEGGLGRAADAFPEAVTVSSAALLGALGPGAIDLGSLAARYFGMFLLLNKYAALLAAVSGDNTD